MKPKAKPNNIRVAVLDGLISMSPSSWERKTLSKDENGKEVVNASKVSRSVLRYPLAQNVSDENVDRLAKRWLK